MMLFITLFSFASSSWAEESDLFASLPPDPGAAGKATLEGIDSDGDGVRDDVQRWIVMNYPNSEKTRAALSQKSRSLQKYLVSANDPNLTYQNALEIDKASECLGYISPNDFYQIGRDMEAVYMNTILRTRMYLQADHSLSGRVFSLLPNPKQGCLFDPDVMLN